MHRTLAWDDLLYVLAIGRAGSLSGAARDLGVNHATVYRRIGKIEESLRVRLFDRQRDGYAPTAAGEAMIALAAEMDEDVVALERRLAGEDLRPSGTVRVTTTDTFISTLMPMLAKFRASYPEIKVELVTGNQMLNLSRRDADVAIRPTPKPDESLVGRKLATLAFAVYGSKQYLASVGGGDLSRNHRWVGFDDSLSHLHSYAWIRRNVDAERVGFRSSSFMAIVEATAQGMGLGILPCYLADLRPDLVRCSDLLAEVATDLWLLVHDDMRHAARVRAFVDFVAAEITRLRPLLEGERHSTPQPAPAAV
jgi:DNA-binding transcriptional LysR family regulator